MLYLYNKHGKPVGFIDRTWVFNMKGRAVGQVHDKAVYRINGDYIGEIYRGMLVDKGIGHPGNVSSLGNPGFVQSPGHPGERGTLDCGFPDISDNLFPYEEG